MSESGSIKRYLNRPAVMMILAVVYFFSAKLGLMLAYVHPSATAVWPPTGFTLAVFLVLGYRVWPGILLGAFLANITTAGSVATSIGIAAGNTLEGLIGAFLVNRYADGRNAFEQPWHIFKFVVLAGIISTMVSATVGVTSLSLGGFAVWEKYRTIWMTWWMGDVAGDLIVAPLLILWKANSRVRWTRGRVFEAVLLLLLLAFVSQAVFGGLFFTKIKKYPLEFMCIPLLVWIAFRFGQREAATGIFILSGISIWGTLHSFGPFVRATPNESLLLLQVFMGVMAVMTLTIAAIVSERKRLDEDRVQLLNREQSARTEAEAERKRIINILDSITDVFIALDTDWRITYLNRKAERFLQRIHKTRSELIGKNLWEAFPDAVSSKFYAECHRAIAEQKTVVFEDFYPPLDTWFGVRIYPSQNNLSVYLQDISERKAQSAALEYQATHDALTDLPNRILLYDRLKQAILVGQRENESLALLILDLDRFKQVNDTLGHQQGDLLLKEMGRRLRTVVRGSDTVARLGGDEFAVILPSVDVDGAVLTAHKVLITLSAPFELKGVTLDVGASIGIAMFPEHSVNADNLLQRADAAMYAAKQSGTGCALYVTSDENRHSPDRLVLIGNLRDAIDHKQLVLHYQPKIDLKTSRVEGVEALVRWQHPQHGLISPDQFIPLAEQTSLIKPLTLWVLDAALRQNRIWQRLGIKLSVSTNLSARNLQDPAFSDQVGRLLYRYDGLHSHLKLEITESAIMAVPTDAMEILARLRKMGVGFSIDDFGTGHSSLGYLKKLPVEEVKIDQLFVKDMAMDEDSVVIVLSIINLAHNLGLRVVAEGVETKEVWDQLRALDCDSAQGYYACHPLPAHEFTRWLKKSPFGFSE